MNLYGDEWPFFEPFADEDVAGLKCDEVETFPGDVLFIQPGVPHSAVPGSNGSVHVTFGVQDSGLRGRNLVEDTIKAARILPADRARLLNATKKLAKSGEGVALRRAIPLP